MTERRLRFSERKRLAETGSLGDLQDAPGAALKNAIPHAIDRVAKRYDNGLGQTFAIQVQDECEEHFGWGRGVSITTNIVHPSTEAFLDFIEIVADVGARKINYDSYHLMPSAVAWPEVEADLNVLFDRHRFGYRLKDGEIHQISSPALDESAIGPALLAVQRPGWEQVEKRFREALLHQRGPASENDDALTAASAALEAGLKAQGYRGKTLGELATDFKKRAPLPGQVTGMAELLDKLLKIPAALRNTMGSAHANSVDVPQAIADLTINMVGSFLVYLAAAEPPTG